MVRVWPLLDKENLARLIFSSCFCTHCGTYRPTDNKACLRDFFGEPAQEMTASFRYSGSIDELDVASTVQKSGMVGYETCNFK